MATTVQRTDAGRLGRATEVAGGGLRVDARIARTGIQVYKRDGKPWRELRPADEVMRADALASFRDAPVTHLHPAQNVTAETRGAVAVGHVSGLPRKDDVEGDLVAADLAITDPRIVDMVRSDQLVELSCGYTCDLDETPGEYEGQRYDAVQRNIRGNHVALLPRGHARAGSRASLRLDAEGHEITPSEWRADSDKGSTVMKVRIDGVDYDPATEAFSQAFAQYQARTDAKLAKLDEVTAERDKATARADAADAKVEKLEEQLAKANDPARLDAAAAERAELVEQARKVAPEIKVDGMSADDIRRAAVEAAGVKLDAEKAKSAAYVEARFDALVADAPTAVEQARAVIAGAGRQDAAPSGATMTAAQMADVLRADAAGKDEG